MKSPILSIIDTICRKVGKNLLRDYFELEDFSSAQFVEKSYEKAIKSLSEELAKKKPEYSVKSSSGEIIYAVKNAKFAFVINPIDGRENFARAIPFFAIVVAVEDLITNLPLVSYIYIPALGNVYFAEKAKGAWRESVLDGSDRARRLRVKQNNSTNAVLCLQDFSDNDNLLGVRMIGASAVACAMFAANKVDKLCIKHYDFACFLAGTLLISEAGGDGYKLNRDSACIDYAIN